MTNFDKIRFWLGHFIWKGWLNQCTHRSVAYALYNNPVQSKTPDVLLFLKGNDYYLIISRINTIVCKQGYEKEISLPNRFTKKVEKPDKISRKELKYNGFRDNISISRNISSWPSIIANQTWKTDRSHKENCSIKHDMDVCVWASVSSLSFHSHSASWLLSPDSGYLVSRKDSLWLPSPCSRGGWDRSNTLWCRGRLTVKTALPAEDLCSISTAAEYVVYISIECHQYSHNLKKKGLGS